MPDGGLCIDWFAGAGVQLEIFCPVPDTKTARDYRLRYIPPFRATIRPPLAPTNLGPGDLDGVLQKLDALAGLVHSAFSRGVGTVQRSQVIAERDESLQLSGSQLFTLVVPPYVQADLRNEPLFLDLGVDEELVSYPWELMHDEEEYLALRHNVGRFVNSATPEAFQARGTPVVGKGIDKLRVLVIGVPKPLARPNEQPLPTLPGVDAEVTAITEALDGGRANVEISVLLDGQATVDKVFRALSSGKYHIVHYMGHATFDVNEHGRSALVLHDGNLTTGQIAKFIQRKTPPFLCFVNACESGKAGSWTASYNLFDLARAFLATGAYLIGSRWKLEDDPAVTVAREFYASLVAGKPIGCALRLARAKARADHPESFAWASYVLYGDPRVYVRSAG